MHILLTCIRNAWAGLTKDGTIRSQRDLFGVFLDRPAGMPELMAGQTQSVSVSRRREQTISSEAQQMLVTPVTEHLVRFVYEGAKDSDPVAGKEDELRTTDGVILFCAARN